MCSTHYVHQDPSGFLLKRLLFGHCQTKLSGGWDRAQKGIFFNTFFRLFSSALWLENHCPNFFSPLANHLKYLWKRLFQGAQKRGGWLAAIPFHAKDSMPVSILPSVTLDPTRTFQNYYCYLNIRFRAFPLVGLNIQMSAEDDEAWISLNIDLLSWFAPNWEVLRDARVSVSKPRRSWAN